MRKTANLRIIWVVFVVFVAAVMAVPMAAAQDAAYPNADLLVDGDWVLEHIDDPDVILVDIRDPNTYGAAHLPGAVNFNVGDVTERENGVPEQVTNAETTAAALGAAGIVPEKMVVIYYHEGSVLYAARLFWVLEYYGYPDVRLLNGGWGAAMVARQQVETDVNEPEPVELSLSADESKRVEGEWIVEHLDDPTLRLIDARGSAEYDGISAASAGHIPGADNIPWAQNFDNNYFLDPDALAALYTDLDLSPDDQIVVYCSTGYRGAVLYLALRLLGYEHVALYDGSWAEWGQHPEWGIESSLS